MNAPRSESVPGAWDVIVIGAGPAGSLAGMLLAREGLSVLLAERRAFPRRKVCGGCLNAHALAALGRAGLGARVHALGALTLDRLHLHHRGRQAVVALPAGLAVSRATLDSALVEAAAEAGCETRFETTATVNASWNDAPGPGRGVRLRDNRGNEESVRARAVVVADGLGHSSLRECAGYECRVNAAARVGLGGEAAGGVLDTARGAITMAVSRHGYAGAVAVEGGRVNIAAAVDPPFLKTCGSPARALRVIFADAGVRLAAPLESIDWTGTPPLTRRLVDPAARGIFVVGDAAGYVEPFTGEGMAWALAGAEAVVSFVARAVRSSGAAAERDWVQARRRIIGRDQRWCRVLAVCLRRPALVAPSVALVNRYPGAAAPIVAHFAPGPRPARERTA